MQKVNLEQLQNALNRVLQADNYDDLSQPCHEVQDILNGVVRDVFRSAGIPVTDELRLVSIDPMGYVPRAAGYYRDMDTDVASGIVVTAQHSANAACALYITLHETMHMIQSFVFASHYDSIIRDGVQEPYTRPQRCAESEFGSQCHAFFQGCVDPTQCDIEMFGQFLQNIPFFHKEDIDILADDKHYYAKGHTYKWNTTEWQANLFASHMVLQLVDQNMLHDADRNILTRYIRDLVDQITSCNPEEKQSRAFKLAQLEESGLPHRLFHPREELEFFAPKDTGHITQTIFTQCNFLREVLKNLGDIETVERLSPSKLKIMQELRFQEHIDEFASQHGMNIISIYTDTPNLRGMSMSFNTYEEMYQTLQKQIGRLPKHLHDKVYIDFENKSIIIDGVGDILREVRASQQQEQEQIVNTGTLNRGETDNPFHSGDDVIELEELE